MNQPNQKTTVPKIAETDVNNSKDIKDVEQILGVETEFIIASSSKKKYEIRPCSMKKIPEVAKRIAAIDDIFKSNSKDGKTEMQLLMEENSPMLSAMADLMVLGLEVAHPDITIDRIMDEFSVRDFPTIYRKVLSLNDFLAGMQTVQSQM